MMGRWIAAAGLALGIAVWSGGARAQVTPDENEAAASAALAALGVAVVPTESLGTLNFLGAEGEDFDFFSTGVRGGFHPRADSPLFLEGLVAVQQYTPSFVLDTGGAETGVDVIWSSLSVTGGIGWDIDVGGGFTFRPMAHLSLGYILSEAILGRAIAPTALPDAFREGLGAGAAGASASLFGEIDLAGGRRVTLAARHTRMRLFPINEPRAGTARADAIRSSALARFRGPIRGARIAGRPLRWVADVGASHFVGDQAEVLRTDWLGIAGIGVEIDTDSPGVPYLSAGRVMLNYIYGEGYEGISLGFGASF